MLDCRTDQQLWRRGVGIVSNDARGMTGATQRRDRLGDGVRTAGGDDDPGALVDEGLCGGEAEPAGATGDEVDAVSQSEIHGGHLRRVVRRWVAHGSCELTLVR